MSKNIQKNIKMANVRLSFPSLFQTEIFAGDDTEKYAATFILDPQEHKNVIKEIESEIKRLTDEKFDGKALKYDRVCLKDGDDSGTDLLEGKYTIKATTKKRPLTINRDKSQVTEDDDIFYAGCYVNAIISLWAQNNQWGKRINASLGGVRFCSHGEPFQAGGVDADEFDMFNDDDIAF